MKPIYSFSLLCLVLSSCQANGLQPPAQPSASQRPTPIPSVSVAPSVIPQATPRPSIQPTTSPVPSPSASIKPTPTPSLEPTPIPVPSVSSSPISPLAFSRIKWFAGTGETASPQTGRNVEDIALPSRFALSADSENKIWMLNTNNHNLGYFTALITRPSLQGDITYHLYWDHSSGLEQAENILYVDTEKAFYLTLPHRHQIVRFDPKTQVQTIVAGTGLGGFNGDGKALESQLNQPTDLARDRQGNFYVTDTGNHLIRKITPDGRMITFAGQYILDDQEDADGNSPSYLPLGETSGDGGPARSARLKEPKSIAVDAEGRVYLTSASETIRRISNDRIERYAGSGDRGYNGQRVLASISHLNRPSDLAIGPDNLLYFVDSGNHRIRRVVSEGNQDYIQDIAGNGKTNEWNESLKNPLTAELDPSLLTFDALGNLYLYDMAHRRIRVLERHNENNGD